MDYILSINQYLFILLIFTMQQTRNSEDIQLVYQCKHQSRVSGCIFISNFEAAANLDTLHKNHINSVITVAKGAFLSHNEQQLPNYLYIPAEDHHDFDLKQFFDQTFTFIENNIQDSNVLVHCMAGISRSATVVIAYIMKKYKKSLKEAYGQIRSCRSMVRPNSGFVEQLKEYEKSIKSVSCSTKQPIKLALQLSYQKLNKMEQSAANPTNKQEIYSKKHMQERIKELKNKLILTQNRTAQEPIIENKLKNRKPINLFSNFSQAIKKYDYRTIDASKKYNAPAVKQNGHISFQTQN